MPHCDIFSCKCMHRCILQVTASSEIGGIQHEQETKNEKPVRGAQCISSMPENNQRMYSCNQHQPGNERSIFHRIPGPVSTKIERLISPGSSHHDPQSQ